MANGKVLTGFSMPWVALYAANNGTVTYSGGIPLARGVDVSLDIEGASDNEFWADNVQAETDSQSFSSGTLGLTVDGLKDPARKMLSGVQNSETVNVGSNVTVKFDDYDEDAKAPYVGVGFVARYQEDGVESFVPYIVPKTKFDQAGLEAATQDGDETNWQPQSLSAKIMRDDSAKHRWLRIGAEQTTEAAAVAAYQAVLTPAAASNTAGTT